MSLKPKTDSPAKRKGQPGPAFTDPERLMMGVQPKLCSAFQFWMAAGDGGESNLQKGLGRPHQSPELLCV